MNHMHIHTLRHMPPFSQSAYTCCVVVLLGENFVEHKLVKRFIKGGLEMKPTLLKAETVPHMECQHYAELLRNVSPS